MLFKHGIGIHKDDSLIEAFDNFIKRYGTYNSFKITHTKDYGERIQYEVEIEFTPSIETRLEMSIEDFIRCMSQQTDDFDDKLYFKDGETYVDVFEGSNEKVYVDVVVTSTLKRHLSIQEWCELFSDDDFDEIITQYFVRDYTETVMYTNKKYMLSHSLIYYFDMPNKNIIFEIVANEELEDEKYSGYTSLTK